MSHSGWRCVCGKRNASGNDRCAICRMPAPPGTKAAQIKENGPPVTMPDPGPSPAPRQPRPVLAVVAPPPTPRQPRPDVAVDAHRGRRPWLLATVVVVLIAAAAAGFEVTQSGSSRGDAPTTAKTATHIARGQFDDSSAEMLIGASALGSSWSQADREVGDAAEAAAPSGLNDVQACLALDPTLPELEVVGTARSNLTGPVGSVVSSNVTVFSDENHAKWVFAELVRPELQDCFTQQFVAALSTKFPGPQFTTNVNPVPSPALGDEAFELAGGATCNCELMPGIDFTFMRLGRTLSASAVFVTTGDTASIVPGVQREMARLVYSPL